MVFGGFVLSRTWGSSAFPDMQQVRVQLLELCRSSRPWNHSWCSSSEVFLGTRKLQHHDMGIPGASHPARSPQALKGRNCISPHPPPKGAASPWAMHPHAEYRITSCQEPHPSPRYCILLVPHPPAITSPTPSQGISYPLGIASPLWVLHLPPCQVFHPPSGT